MASVHQTCPPTACVGNPSLWNMHWTVPVAVSHLSGTMSCVTSQLTSSQKSATMSGQNQACSHCPKNNWSTESLQHSTSTMLSTERACRRRREHIWWTGERSRTWHILPPCLLDLWWHGTRCHCGIQKDCLPHRWEAAAALQPDFVLAEMQVELLALALSNHVSQRCTLILPPPSRTFQDWRAHRPDLLRGSNPSPRLINEPD